MQLESYKKIIQSDAKYNVTQYMNRFKEKQTLIFYSKDTFEKYQDILHLHNQNNFIFINIEDQIDSNRYKMFKPSQILILVENFYFHAKIFKYLHDNNLFHNDICTELLLDLDLLKPDIFELFWYNITKLTITFTKDDFNNIIKNNHKSYKELFKTLLYKNNLISKEDANAIIYLETYTDTFGNLTKDIDNLIVFCNRKIEEKNFFFGIDYLQFFDFIHLFIGTTSKKLPKNCKYININHGIVDDPSPITQNANITANIEHSFHSRKTRHPITLNIVSSKLLNFENSISLGYPKLDNFIKYYNTNKEIGQSNIIMIAISTIMWNCNTLTPIVHDSPFIENLLQKFPSNPIVFRPHPEEIENPYILEYTHQLKEYNNFIFDTEKSYIDKFTHTRVFISDGLGSSAYTYAFATLQPVIFYIPKLEKYFEDYKHKYYVQNLEIVGDIVTKRDDLIRMVDKYLKNKDYTEQKSEEIKKLRDKNILNIGSSENAIKQFIQQYITIEKSNKIKNHYINTFRDSSKLTINQYFEKFKNKKIAIYGAGDHFETILNNIYDFSTLNIVCFSDSNTNLIGTKKYNIPIISKDSLDNVDAIIISSKKYEKEIKKELDSFYVNVHTIYEHIGNDIALYLQLDNDIQFFHMWLNIQLLEHHLTNEEIKQIINDNYLNYEALFLSCNTLATQRNKIIFTNENEKLYTLSSTIYLAKM